MPRKSRIDAPGALHYIIVRGIEQKEIFKDNLDHNTFLDRLNVILTDNKGTEPMKDLLIQIVKALVDNPEQVQVNEVVSAQTVVLELKVDKSDMGKVIGKQGKTAYAIRTLLNAASGKTRKRYVLEIVE
jgi:predicted RNA-binding protein YlqC (UPF0109 family)